MQTARSVTTAIVRRAETAPNEEVKPQVVAKPIALPDRFESTATPTSPASRGEGDDGTKLSPLELQRVQLMMALIKERQGKIDDLAKSLSSDFELKVEPGIGWAYELKSNTVTYPAAELLDRPLEEVLGHILHEIGHRRFTKLKDIKDVPELANDPLAQKSFYRLWNAIEDPRVNNLVMQSYGGAEKYMKALYEDEFLSQAHSDARMQKAIATMRARYPKLKDVHDETIREMLGYPRTEQLALGTIHRWAAERFRGHRIACPFLKDPEVAKVLDRLWEHIAKAITPWRDISKQPLTAAEIRAQSIACFDIVAKEIWPIYKQLLEQDRLQTQNDELLEDFAEANTDPEDDDDGSESQSPPQPSRGDSYKTIEKKLTEKASEDGEQSPADGESQPQQANDGSPRDQSGSADKADKGTDTKSSAKKNGRSGLTLDDLTTGDLKEEQEKAAKQVADMLAAARKSIRNDYEERARRQSRSIDVLQAHMATAYLKEQMPTWDPIPMHSGQRWNMRRAMQSRFKYNATGTYDDRVYNRRTMPTKRDVEIVFVVDCSRSVQSNMQAFKDALVQCMEAATLEKIKINLVLFSDKVASYSFELGSDEHQTAMELIDAFPTGSTNDVGGLTAAITMLEASQAKQRAVVLITDGDGKNKDAQKALVASCEDKGIDVYGLGVGPGMTAVEEVYPNRGLAPSPDEVPDTLGTLMVEIASKKRSQHG